MKISNFRNYGRVGATALEWTFFADVDVTTGLLFRKTTTRRVSREYASSFWRFVDNGEYCPGHEVEKLEFARQARDKDK